MEKKTSHYQQRRQTTLPKPTKTTTVTSKAPKNQPGNSRPALAPTDNHQPTKRDLGNSRKPQIKAKVARGVPAGNGTKRDSTVATTTSLTSRTTAAKQDVTEKAMTKQCLARKTAKCVATKTTTTAVSAVTTTTTTTAAAIKGRHSSAAPSTSTTQREDHHDKPAATRPSKKTSSSSMTDVLAAEESTKRAVVSTTQQVSTGGNTSNAEESTKRAVVSTTQQVSIGNTSNTARAELQSLLPDCTTTNLPSCYYDPDSNDRDDPQLCTEYVREIYQHLLNTERKKEFKLNTSFMALQTGVDNSHRRVLVDWLAQVHMKFNHLPDTLHICMDIIDRYLKVVDVPKKDLQLVGITALFIAAKYEEIYPCSIEELAYVAADTYTTSEIRRRERDILLKLDYQLSKPIPLVFLRRYSKLLSTTTHIHNLAKFFIEVSYLSTECHSLLPSQCAAGALALAATVTTGDDVAIIWGPTMQRFTWYSSERVSIFLKDMLRQVNSYYQLCKQSSRFGFIRNKYTQNYHGVAGTPQLQHTLEELCHKLSHTSTTSST